MNDNTERTNGGLPWELLPPEEVQLSVSLAFAYQYFFNANGLIYRGSIQATVQHLSQREQRSVWDELSNIFIDLDSKMMDQNTTYRSATNLTRNPEMLYVKSIYYAEEYLCTNIYGCNRDTTSSNSANTLIDNDQYDLGKPVRLNADSSNICFDELDKNNDIDTIRSLNNNPQVISQPVLGIGNNSYCNPEKIKYVMNCTTQVETSAGYLPIDIIVAEYTAIIDNIINSIEKLRCLIPIIQQHTSNTDIKDNTNSIHSEYIKRLIEDHSQLPPSERNIFYRDHDQWVIVFQGSQPVFAKDSTGMRHIAKLIACPHKEWNAIDLMKSNQPASIYDSPTSDDNIRNLMGITDQVDISELPISSYQSYDFEMSPSQLKNLKKRKEKEEGEYAEACKNKDTKRAESLKSSIEILQKIISVSANHVGRPRRFNTTGDKARKAVSYTIIRAIQYICKLNPCLYEHLSATIKRGSVCCYRPAQNIHWITDSIVQ